MEVLPLMGKDLSMQGDLSLLPPALADSAACNLLDIAITLENISSISSAVSGPLLCFAKSESTACSRRGSYTSSSFLALTLPICRESDARLFKSFRIS